MQLSILVPYYNNGATMKRCIRSLTTSLKAESYEVIIIDDGSESSELAKLRTFLMQKSWRQVKLVEQQHQGAAAARNRGIQEATGHYLTFVDADDYIANSAIDTFLDLIKEVQVDEAGTTLTETAPDLFKLGPMVKNDRALIAAEDGLRDFADKQAKMEERVENTERMGASDTATQRMLDSMLVESRTTRNPMSLMKPLTSCLDHTTYLYRRDFLKQNHLAYPENMQLMEDSYFILSCLEAAHTLANYDELMFYCFDQSHSYGKSPRGNAYKRWSRTQSRHNVDDCLRFFAKLHTLAQQNTIVQPLYDRYLYVYMRVLAVKCSPWSDILHFRKDAAATANSLYFATPTRRRPRMMGNIVVHHTFSITCRIARVFRENTSFAQKNAQA